MVFSRLSAALAASSLLVPVCLTASPPIKVSMHTSWDSPAALLELIETVAINEPEAFFPLLDVLTDPEIIPRGTSRTPEALEQLVLHSAASLGYLKKPMAREFAQMQLALHSASPKLEAFYKHYVDVVQDIGALRDMKSCGSWVYWYGEVVCDSDRLHELTAYETIEEEQAVTGSPNSSFMRPKILPFDHIYPLPMRSLSTPPRTAILFASVSSSNFRELHSHLLSLSRAKEPKLEYVFRPIPDSSTGKHTPLTGYGVTLDLKKTDYLVIDDRLSNNKATPEENDQDQKAAEEGIVPSADRILTLLEKYDILNDSVKLTDPLTEEELARLGLQATQLVMESEAPLATLKQLSQDFPRYASSVARRVVPSENVTNEAMLNSMRTRSGNTLVWLNGGILSPDRMNPFSLLAQIRKEEDVMLSLTSLGLSPNASFELMAHPIIDAPYTANDVLEGIFDASDRAEGGHLIIWLNDLEKDARYARWESSVFSLLQPQMGGLPGVRLNLLNIVLALDLSSLRSIYFTVSTVGNLIQRGLPLRFGIVPLVDGTMSNESVQIAKVISYLMTTFDLQTTTNYLKQLLTGVKEETDLDKPVNLDYARAVFEALSEAETPAENAFVLTWNEIIDSEQEEDSTMATRAREYAQRLDIDLESSPRGHAFVNGRHYDVNDQLLGMLQADVNKFLRHIQEQIYLGHLSDASFEDSDPSAWFYDLPTSYKRRSHLIIPSGNPSDVSIFSLPAVFDQTALDAPGSFVNPEESRTPSSIYVIGDFDTEEGFFAMQFGLSFLTSTDARSRMSFIHNPIVSKEASDPHTAVSKVLAFQIVSGKLRDISPTKLLHAFMLPAPSDEHPEEAIAKAADTLGDIMDGINIEDVDPAIYASYEHSCAFVTQRLGLEGGETALLINGRLIGPFSPASMMPADFEALERYEFTKRVQPTLDVLDIVHPEQAELDDAAYAKLVANAVSIVSDVRIPDPSESGLYNSPLSSRNPQYRRLDGKHTMFTLGDEETALIRFGVIFDTLSEEAQKYSALLEWISSLPHVHIEVHLLPAPYSEMPLKRFYRYNLIPRLSYDESGEEVTPLSTFEALPTEPIYTLGLDEPPSWLVRPRDAIYDLDNIQLSTLSGTEQQTGVEVGYELDYIIVDGHAREGRAFRAPRGLQLQLASNSTGAIADTLVMDNLGYLQFKAAPGVYTMEIREGIGRDIYDIASVGNDGWNSPSVDEGGDVVTVTSFEGLTLYPRLTRRPGMERADVLAPVKDQEDESLVGSVMSGFSSFFGGKKEKAKPPSRHADINIFTVASGMLYERFASIMILSVLRNTNHTVKFWFIENFLSPSFLEFIPQFAKEYSFEYELVTYKWPKWLRRQSEKQRIIWAYKILFLDVLFPMDLDRVIFVDADQIVRTDLYELVEMDLQGAPYAYTPMGDDNTDMEGFRFWKHGYWKQTLQGRPYHISALYVIDLIRFRQFAAGDILRTHYHELSADPNSLANLDQDLPNNLQAYVPIYSLPEDWLWCETWCSKDRLDRAKTIDLCQNPLTKEPKLSRARQIPEWEVYDSEIARFARRLADEGRIHATAAAADVAQLANAASVKSGVEATDNGQKPDNGAAEGDMNKAQRPFVVEPKNEESEAGAIHDELSIHDEL